MARNRFDPPASDDVTPADLGGNDRVAELEAQLAAARAERDAHAAELARVKAGPLPFAAQPGQRFLVKLTDSPSWVVEPDPGEHPWEAYKRATGVQSSIHTPEIHPTDAPVGRAA